MNDNTQLWIDALRGGAYRQTSRRLRQPGRFFWQRAAFCAIGVLYDVYLKSHGKRWPARPTPGQLPQPVLEWAGLSRELEYEVVTLNDMGTTFADIASIVEATFHRANRDSHWKQAGRITLGWIEQVQRATRRHRAARSLDAPTKRASVQSQALRPAAS